MSIVLVNCTECKAPLDPDAPGTLRRVTAWERKSASTTRRSGSDLLLREPFKNASGRREYLCETCVRRLKRGVQPLQGQLV